MVKQLSITMIFVTSVLGLGAIGFDSFVVGQPNVSSSQTTSQPNTFGAGGGGGGGGDGSCIITKNSSSQTPNQPNTFGPGGGGGGDGISVDSNNNCGTLIIIR